MFQLGIDAGASAVKLAAAENGELVFKKYIPGHPDVAAVMSACGLRAADIGAVALTGLHAEKLAALPLPVPHRLINEFEAVAAGARLLSGRDRFIAASVGTGTAYISVDGERASHIGGTGVGGGTLCGLGSLLGFNGAEELLLAASEGELSRVDLTIGDIQPDSTFLDPRLTAANLAKISPDADKNDWAAGAVNLVLQAVGSMALLAARAAGTDAVVLTGALMTSRAAEENFRNFQNIYGTEFIIPPHAECATAFGAAMLV